MATQDMIDEFGEDCLGVIQESFNTVRGYLALYHWGKNMVHRSGWLVRYDNGERVYVHESGWKVKDFCGPNEGIAMQMFGPDAGKVLENPGGRLFFSALQAMQYVEKYLRGET